MFRIGFLTMIMGMISFQALGSTFIECYANDSSGSSTVWIAGRCTLHDSERQYLYDQIVACAAGNAQRACRARHYGSGFPCDVEAAQCQEIR
jgi:hypothetical protein